MTKVTIGLIIPCPEDEAFREIYYKYKNKTLSMSTSMNFLKELAVIPIVFTFGSLLLIRYVSGMPIDHSNQRFFANGNGIWCFHSIFSPHINSFTTTYDVIGRLILDPVAKIRYNKYKECKECKE